MRFVINPRVIEQLGKELITSNEVAITELIKNSYDANANEARIHFISKGTEVEKCNFLEPLNQFVLNQLDFQNDIMVLEDNGDGMNLSELEEGFFTVGTDLKKVKKDAGNFKGRPPLGEKGIGRLATQRLSKVLYIETTDITSDEVVFVKVDWERLLEQGKLEDMELVSEMFETKSKKYTRLWFLDLNVEFDEFIKFDMQLDFFNEESQLKEKLQSSLSFLMSPFVEKQEDFKMSIHLNSSKLKTEFENLSIKVAETEHSFRLVKENEELVLRLKMSLKPWYLERVHEIFVGKENFDLVRKDHTFYSHLLRKYQERYDSSLKVDLKIDDLKRDWKFDNSTLFNTAIKAINEISPLNGKVYSFKRDRKLSKMALESARANNFFGDNTTYNVDKLKTFLDFHNGIKLYRGKFRVTTLGDKDSDWLEFQQARTRGQQFFRFELGNTIGFVNINDPVQNFIKEISSRQDLMENVHSQSVRGFLKLVFHKYFYEFSRSAYYISEDILKEEGLFPKRSIDELRTEVTNTGKVAIENKNLLKNFNEYIDNINKNIDLDSEEKINYVKKAFVELTNTTDFINNNIQQAIVASEKTNEALLKVEREKKLVELETYNNYKLMANGLITEVITHELHSILSGKNSEDKLGEHFKSLKTFLIEEVRNIEIYAKHFKPLHSKFNNMNSKMLEMSDFYKFLENTFLYKGTFEEFELENIGSFIMGLEKRLSNRLKHNEVSLNYVDLDLNWKVPKGALIHIFYNLIDNSIYWINQRMIRSKNDKFFMSECEDFIEIKKLNENTLIYSDTGTGIFPNMNHVLFHPLKSGKDTNGRGMGLYIVKKMLNSFGADIELLEDKNKYGHRYKFAIHLKNEDIKIDGEFENGE